MALKPVDFNTVKTKEHPRTLIQEISIQYMEQRHKINFGT
jgi:hypothetical protein